MKIILIFLDKISMLSFFKKRKTWINKIHLLKIRYKRINRDILKNWILKCNKVNKLWIINNLKN